jgi:hypothetical protein
MITVCLGHNPAVDLSAGGGTVSQEEMTETKRRIRLGQHAGCEHVDAPGCGGVECASRGVRHGKNPSREHGLCEAQ